MQLSIVGCPDKKLFRPYVKRAAIFYAQELMKPKMLENIYLRIKFNGKIPVYGYAEILEYNESRKAREFEIEINPNIGAADILKCLAHEMVHIKQFVRGHYKSEKSRNGKYKKFWLGEQVLAKYEKQPWEVEAYKKQGILLDSLLTTISRKIKRLQK